jgi:hypothetical protein
VEGDDLGTVLLGQGSGDAKSLNGRGVEVGGVQDCVKNRHCLFLQCKSWRWARLVLRASFYPEAAQMAHAMGAAHRNQDRE